jgi:hypothetical protein
MIEHNHNDAAVYIVTLYLAYLMMMMIAFYVDHVIRVYDRCALQSSVNCFNGRPPS